MIIDIGKIEKTKATEAIIKVKRRLIIIIIHWWLSQIDYEGNDYRDAIDEFNSLNMWVE